MFTLLQVSDLVTAEQNSANIAELFMNGGIFQMSTITLLLILMLFAAWKAPRWIKEIGAGALALSVIMTLVRFSNAAGAVIQCNGEIHPCIIWGGVRCSCILLAYGFSVYLVSLILRMVIKPRI